MTDVPTNIAGIVAAGMAAWAVWTGHRMGAEAKRVDNIEERLKECENERRREGVRGLILATAFAQVAIELRALSAHNAAQQVTLSTEPLNRAALERTAARMTVGLERAAVIAEEQSKRLQMEADERD